MPDIQFGTKIVKYMTKMVTFWKTLFVDIMFTFKMTKTQHTCLREGQAL